MRIINADYEASFKTLQWLNSSIARFHDKKDEEFQEIIRDSVVKAFIFSTDTFCYFLKNHLRGILKLQLKRADPRTIFSIYLNEKLVSHEEYEILKNILKDRARLQACSNPEFAPSKMLSITAYHQTMNQIIARLNIERVQ